MDDLSFERTIGGGAGARSNEKWSLAEGATLGGYRVVKPLGRGGMGEVYLAENIQTGVEFALKLLPSDLASDSGFRERFRREAAVLQTLRHDGIVMVHHAAEEGGRFFLTMDYVEGGSLEDLLRGGDTLRAEPVVGARHAVPLQEDEVARIALELCEALAYAHGKGVIHRDIKPANVLLDSAGRAKLSDFGLARVVGDEFLKSMTERSVSLSMARTGGGAKLSQSDNAVIGTYEYMSPEQQAGVPADERSDMYSLGLVIYRVLTGERAVGRFPDPSKVGCSAAWDPVVDRALASKASDRYPSVAELADALGQVREAVSAGAEEARRREDERGRRQAEERARREREEAEWRRREERARAQKKARAEAAALRLAQDGGTELVEGAAARAREAGAPRRGCQIGAAAAVGSVALVAVLVAVLASGKRSKTAEPARREARPPTAARGTRPRQTLALDLGGGVAMELVLVPAGEFTMGSPDSEAKRYDDEGPQHRVRITQAFHMGKYEVTQSQYERVIGTNPSKFKGSNNPVEQVSWDDATEFCRKLSERSGRKVRLPTEAEWEYACRAGTTTPFHYGSSLGSDEANFDGNYPYGGAAKGTYRRKTTPVGSFQRNAWGLHDMHGNVWEWCSDWYDKGYYAKSPRQDPAGPANGGSGVLRGGSWFSLGKHCRSAYRDRFHPTDRRYLIGFRVAVVAPGR